MRSRAQSTPRRRYPRAAAVPVPVLLATILAVLGAAEPPPAAADGTAAAQEAETAVSAASDAAGEAAGEGEEEEWLVDEETGQRYRVQKIQNIEANYRWVDEDTIRYRYGVHFEVVDYDDESLWVKVFHSALKEPVKPDEKSEEEKAAELARIAETYDTDVATVDRLEFVGFDNGLPQSGQWRQGFDVADMNADGHLDIVFGPARKNMRPQPNIFLGDSRGNWRRWSEARFAPLAYDYGDAAAGDLNGDGHLDLVFGVHLRGLLALVGDGKGEFRAWTDGLDFDVPGEGGGGSGFSSRAVELYDWNGDGRLDILALGEGPKGRKTGADGEVIGEILNTARGLVVYLNLGDGRWALQSPNDTPDSFLGFLFGDGFTLGDFNRDDRLDIAVASRMRNNREILGIGTEDGWASRPLEALRHRIFVGAVAAEDSDGDGKAELLVGYQSHDLDKVWRTGVDVYSADEDLAWERRPLFASEGRRGIYAVATGDLDGDGHLDLVTASGSAELWVFLGDGEGFFVHESSAELPAPTEGCHGYALGLQDFDGDGRDELIAGFAGEETGLPGIAGYHQVGCPREGSLRVWKAVALPGV